MKYIEFCLAGMCLGFGVFCVLAGIGCALKTVQWYGKKLGVKPFDA